MESYKNDDLAILYCREKGPWHNYIVDEAIDFRYVERKDAQSMLNSRKKAEICWGFLLIGKLESWGGQEVIKLEKGDMFYCLFPLILFTSDRLTPYCMTLANELAD